jgi:hypothetical protein
MQSQTYERSLGQYARAIEEHRAKTAHYQLMAQRVAEEALLREEKLAAEHTEVLDEHIQSHRDSLGRCHKRRSIALLDAENARRMLAESQAETRTELEHIAAAITAEHEVRAEENHRRWTKRLSVLRNRNHSEIETIQDHVTTLLEQQAKVHETSLARLEEAHSAALELATSEARKEAASVAHGQTLEGLEAIKDFEARTAALHVRAEEAERKLEMVEASWEDAERHRVEVEVEFQQLRQAHGQAVEESDGYQESVNEAMATVHAVLEDLDEANRTHEQQEEAHQRLKLRHGALLADGILRRWHYSTLARAFSALRHQGWIRARRQVERNAHGSQPVLAKARLAWTEEHAEIAAHSRKAREEERKGQILIDGRRAAKMLEEIARARSELRSAARHAQTLRDLEGDGSELDSDPEKSLHESSGSHGE